MSLPILEAWIEVLWVDEEDKNILRRFLYWKRGLKYGVMNRLILTTMSLPILEAWIEV